MNIPHFDFRTCSATALSKLSLTPHNMPHDLQPQPISRDLYNNNTTPPATPAPAPLSTNLQSARPACRGSGTTESGRPFPSPTSPPLPLPPLLTPVVSGVH